MRLSVNSTILAVCFAVLATSASSKEYLLFGGSGHDQFLGCWQCNAFEADSICNEFGKGSIFLADGIFNQFSQFGSQFSSEGVWNAYSSSRSVPVLVDQSGVFYGYFTINQYRSDAVDIAADLAMIFDLADGNLEVVREFLCR